MGFILSILAIFLLCIVHVVDYVFSLVFDVKNRQWFNVVGKRNFKKAFNIDVFGNYQYREFWNFAFSKKGNNYKFGKFGETLSSCFGKKRLEKSLNFFGLLTSIIIDIIDISKWRKQGHCIASIMTDDEINTFLNRF